MNEQEITQLIVRTVTSRGSMIGTQLASIVKGTFPEFQGLKAHIDRFCSGQVVPIGRRGTDFVYAAISPVPQPPQIALSTSASPPTPQLPQIAPTTPAAQEPPPAPPWTHSGVTSPAGPPPADPLPQPSGPPRARPDSALIPPGERTFWQTFAYTFTGDRLAVDPVGVELRIVPEASPIQPPFVEVSKASSGEYKRILNEFLARVEPSDLPTFQQAAATANPWPGWAKLTRTFAAGKYLAAWLDHRNASLFKLFRERLQALGMDDAAMTRLANQLLESKRRKARNFQTPRGEAKAPSAQWRTLDRVRGPADGGELQRLATLAISEMSPDDLRRLWLPLGALLNALRSDEP